jgi:Na(+)-translocating NADH:ubiquinone oxidoreductase B subunit
MKLIARMLENARPRFEGSGKYAAFHPVYRAADNFFFAARDVTAYAPFGRDPLDVKRYMSLVIVALFPCFAAGVYFFGLRVLLMMLVAYAAGGAVEVLFSIVRKDEINEGFLVTGFIFPLILPPGLPLWMVAVGMIFGVLVGKEVFGGTGRNLFNPALIGRCFLALSYPGAMTKTWLPAARGFGGGVFANLSLFTPDNVTSATPLVMAKSGHLSSLHQLFVGRVAGSAGETSAVAIVIGGAFLLLVGVANWRTVVGVLVSFVGLNALLLAAAPAHTMPVVFNLLSGGLLFGAFFMATDPVTSPVTQWGKWSYGILIGVATILIRTFSVYVEGVMFAILLGNIAAPLIDQTVIRYRSRGYRNNV